jgi:cyclopropane-fatty-acyl-phospholipid synthase
MRLAGPTDPLRKALDAALPERPFRLELWDGSALPSAGGDGPTFSLRSPAALGHLLRSPGQLGVGRAYVTGALDVDSIDGVLELLDDWSPRPIDARAKARIASAAVRAGALQSVPHVPDAELRPRGRRHSIARDRRAVRHHYDVSNEFFALFLGESMTYSCAIFSRGAATLEEAQETKLELVCTNSGCGAACASWTSAAAGAASPSMPPRATACTSPASRCPSRRPRWRASAPAPRAWPT